MEMQPYKQPPSWTSDYFIDLAFECFAKKNLTAQVWLDAMTDEVQFGDCLNCDVLVTNLRTT